ncbi:MAG: phosphatase PAP2 family protein [Bacteroidetes bacterium]|nr:phosphatase PAP2 family protein [Bacteroidota bacterium]
MKLKIYLSLLLIIIGGSSLVGQQQYTFSQFWNETGDFVKQPTKWDGIDYVKIGVMSFLTYEIMMNYDQPIRDAVLKDQRYYKSFPIEFGRIWGEIYSPIVLFSGFAAYSLLTDDIGTRKIAYEIGQASLYAGALSFLLKLAIGRSRPYLNEGTHSFSPFSSILNQDNKSLPSGHSTVAFILSTVLSRNVKSPVFKVLAYLPAVLTLVSRVYQDQHWASDTFAGAALGYFVATWVVDQHENNKSIVEVSSVYPLFIRIPLN